MHTSISRVSWLRMLGLAAVLCWQAEAQVYTFTTLAGQGPQAGSADGVGVEARFYFPGGVAWDAAGNLYVTDSGNSTIRKITPAGVVTTLAGLAGSSGSADGTGTAARFSWPSGVAADLSGNLYVADQNNLTIRKITPAGVVTTLAGLAGNSGSADGTGSAARFNNPYGVAADLSGNLYVADQNNLTIRKITPVGVVTTLAGLAGRSGDADGLGAAARFAVPGLVSVNAGGTVAVADIDNNAIRTITPAGLVTTLAGSGGGSIGSTDGPGSTARFFGPTGAVLDPENNLYVVDTDNHTIRKITPAGVVSTIAVLTGSSDTFPWSGFGPSGIARDGAGNLYVTDTGNGRVLKITSAGEVTTFASVVDGGNSLTGIALDSSGNVFVADTWSHTIRRITPTGDVSVFAGQMWNGGYADGVGVNAQFAGPSGLVIDGADNLYVADTWNHVIRKITPAGMVSTVSGVVRTWAPPDGPDAVEAATRFSHPTGLARDNAGNFYVTEFYGNNRIWKVTPDGMVSWIAGRIPGCADGVGTAARFNYPSSIVVDTSGNLYVTDFGNNTIRKGVLITVTALVRHAPTLNGSIDGSIQVLSGENLTLNGNMYISGDLLVPGTPTVRLNGHATYGGILNGNGSPSPSNYVITLNGNVIVHFIVQHTDPIALPVVNAPSQPTGTRNVSLNSPSQSVGDFATVRNLTLNGNAGQVAVPAGTYGSFTANGNSGFVLGVPGATEPTVYNLQSLTLNGNSQLQVVGPVILTLANSVTFNGTVGSSAELRWLTLNVYSGDVTLSGNATFNGCVVAPAGAVTINGNSTLNGGVISDRLTVNGNGLVSEQPQ